MANQQFLARIVGIPHIPSIRQINVRSGPSTDYQLVFKANVGAANLAIIDVQPDATGKNLRGKVYQWFHIDFGNSQYGWARDDLIEVSGDGTSAGYSVVSVPTLGFNLTRRQVMQPGQEVVVQPVAQPVQPVSQPATAFQPTGAVQPVSQPTTAFQPTGAVQPVSQPATAFQPTAQPVTTQPVAQPATAFQPTAQPATAQPVAQPVAQPTAIELPDRVGPAMGQCMGKTGVNVRSGPGSNNGQIARMNYMELAPILESADGQDGKDFKWAKVDYKGAVGWVRIDYLRLSGDFSNTGLATTDLYPNPAPDSWWVRDFDKDGSRIGAIHHGWDHAGEIGAPILAGPYGGTVVRVANCTKCGPQGLSIMAKGLQLGDSRVLNDPAWNYGYGHFIIVRYDHDKLPEFTKSYVASQGASGAHVFVMYAHLSKILVQNGEVVSPNHRIADLGNSGQSSGPHLHLEVRFSTNPDEQWARMNAGLRSPEILYLR